MPIHIQNSGFAKKGNLHLANTQGLSGYASATILTNILEVAGLNGFFRASATTLNMPVASKTWTIISSGYDATNTGHILAIADNIDNATLQSAYIGHIASGAVVWVSLAGYFKALSNENLNNCNVLNGVYYATTAEVASALTNCPVIVPFGLTVEHTGAGIRQTLRTYSTSDPETYVRDFYNTTWGAWFNVANAKTAQKWATARTITFGGDLTGNFNIDGSGNVTATVAVNDDSHNHVIGNVDNLQSALDLKAPLASPSLSGTPTVPTATAGTNNTQVASTAFVVNALSSKAPLANPALTGVPTAPTAAKTVNNTQLATTAFVHLLAGAANNGGIVDSLLAQNGYVKFANGLIIQWGVVTNTTSITFPVAFGTAYGAIATATTQDSTWPHDTGGVKITNLSQTACNIYKHRAFQEQANAGDSSSPFTGFYCVMGCI